MNFKLLLLGALCALSLPSAWAKNVLINDQPYDVKALVKIDELKDLKTGRRYHYQLNDSDKELILSQPIEDKEIPVLVPFSQLHPVKARLKSAWKSFKRFSEVFQVGAGVFNALKALFS